MSNTQDETPTLDAWLERFEDQLEVYLKRSVMYSSCDGYIPRWQARMMLGGAALCQGDWKDTTQEALQSLNTVVAATTRTLFRATLSDAEACADEPELEGL